MKQVPYRYRKPKLNNFGSAILVPVPVRNVNEQNSFSPEECVQSVFRTDFRGKERGARLGSTGCKGMDKAVEQLELPVLCTNFRVAISLFVLAY